jgi:diguanylate cyclase (GGDEF)-like protein
VERAILEGRVASSTFDVLFIDLDRFKHINDTHGHATGDDVLQQVARRLRNSVPKEVILGRAGGDEFIIVNPHADSLMSDELCKIIEGEFREPFEVSEGAKADLGVSIGAATFPRDGHDAATILKAADLALYRAKRASRLEAVLAA